MYLAIAEDGVVDHDAMDASILVGLYDFVLKVIAGTCTKLKLDAGLSTSLCGPFGVLGSSGVFVGKESNQLGTDVAGLDRVLELLSVVSEVEGGEGRQIGMRFRLSHDSERWTLIRPCSSFSFP